MTFSEVLSNLKESLHMVKETTHYERNQDRSYKNQHVSRLIGDDADQSKS